MTKEELTYCFDTWFDGLRNYITYRCGDPELATDIAQETFVKLWEKQLNFEANKTKGLLYKIAGDLWISQYRKSQSAEKYLTYKKSTAVQEDSTDVLEAKELEDQYHNALLELPEKRRTVFLMSRVDELTYKEIAERLEISVKAVEKRMSAAITSLKKTLQL